MFNWNTKNLMTTFHASLFTYTFQLRKNWFSNSYLVFSLVCNICIFNWNFKQGQNCVFKTVYSCKLYKYNRLRYRSSIRIKSIQIGKINSFVFCVNNEALKTIDVISFINLKISLNYSSDVRVGIKIIITGTPISMHLTTTSQ